MVLHLLGKKGWNVYNSDNVERVRRDEAEAQAREEAREQRMQDEDAARRLALLRGEDPPQLTVESAEEPQSSVGSKSDAARPRKRRRLRGEDDTDADIRHARQDVAVGEQARSTLAKPGKEHEDAPLLDHAGHLQLIPAPDEKAIRKAEKNAEVEAEKAKKRERQEQQYTMRFTDAAGFNSSVQQKPWYAGSQTAKENSAVVLAEAQGKDVWGNEDPLRKTREQSRISKSDPFAAMQQAQRQLKQSERDREGWRREREVEMGEVRRAEKEEARRAEKRERRRRRSERRHADDWDSLDGFYLDAPPREEEHAQASASSAEKSASKSKSRSFEGQEKEP